MRGAVLPAIMAAYLALAVGYNLATPFGAPPDERPHALYVEHLVERRALPVLRREQREAYEAHQPPLYYLLAAPVWAATRGLPEEQRAFLLRLVSTAIGAGGLLLLARLAAVTRPGDRWLGLGAVAFATFLPMRLATAAAIGNDLLAELVFTATLLLLALSIRHGITARRTAAIGLLLGAGLLSKSTCLLLFPIALLGLALAGGRAATAKGREATGRHALAAEGLRSDAPSRFGGGRVTDAAASDVRLRRHAASKGASVTPSAPIPVRPPSPARTLQAIAGAFALALLVGGWWLARNVRLYGEVFVAKTFVDYFQDTARPEIFLARGHSLLSYLLLLVLPLTFRSFWGVFGHMQVYMGALSDAPFMPPSWVYPLLALPTAAALVGLVRAYLRRRDLDTTERAVWGLLVVTWLLVAAAFLRFNTEFFQAQGRYLFPAMGPIVLLFTLGLLSLFPVRRHAAVAITLAVGMGALAVYALTGCILPAFRA